MRLAFSSSVFPNPFVAMTMNLSSRSGVRKLSISGVRWSSAASKSSATRISSASTVQARMIPSNPLAGASKHSVSLGGRLASRCPSEAAALPPRADLLGVLLVVLRAVLLDDLPRRPLRHETIVRHLRGRVHEELVRAVELEQHL